MSTTTTSAAKSGQLEILKWCRQHECNWNMDTTKYAAKRGHLEVFKWSLENGCPWSSIAICFSAASNGHLDILEYFDKFDTIQQDYLDMISKVSLVHGFPDITAWVNKKRLST